MVKICRMIGCFSATSSEITQYCTYHGDQREAMRKVKNNMDMIDIAMEESNRENASALRKLAEL